MTSAVTGRLGVGLGAVALAVLFMVGLVLASSWFVAFPEGVLKAAWLIAIAAMVTVFVSAFREAHTTGSSFLGSIGRSFKALGRFVVAFF